MDKQRYFRAGVGTVIFKSPTEVAFFRRAKYPIGVWQFQQGGIDFEDHPEDTLWRELKEETGLTKTDCSLAATYPTWTIYQDAHATVDASAKRLGQAHRWFFLQLQPTTEIDLTKATDDEFDATEFISFEEAIERTSDHKKHVYEELHAFFLAEVVPKLN